MSMIIRNNVRYAAGGGNLNIVKLTQAEYDALPDSKYSDGILYAIEDGEISSTGGSAKAITISQEDFDKLSEEEKASGIYVIPDGEDLTAKNLFYNGSVTGLGNTVQDAIDNLSEQNKNLESCFQSVSNGKALVASAITDKGVVTSEDATFETMANNIAAISTDIVDAQIGGSWTGSGANHNSVVKGSSIFTLGQANNAYLSLTLKTTKACYLTIMEANSVKVKNQYVQSGYSWNATAANNTVMIFAYTL